MANLLPLAVRSVVSQSLPAYEILVVDDCSTDATPQVLEGLVAETPALRVLRSTGETPSAARNLALAQASGDVIAFLDADDLWPETKLERQLGRLQRSPAVDVVWGKVRWFDRQHAEHLRPADDARILDVFGVNLGAGIVRRTVLDRIGPLDASLTYSEDVDFVLRIRDFGVPIAVLPSVTLYYRRHPNAMTTTLTPTERTDLQKVFLRSVARRGVGRGRGFSPTGVLADLVEEEP
jgi:glycosyltransferase involved in cell wall biosynthesis